MFELFFFICLKKDLTAEIRWDHTKMNSESALARWWNTDKNKLRFIVARWGTHKVSCTECLLRSRSSLDHIVQNTGLNHFSI